MRKKLNHPVSYLSLGPAENGDWSEGCLLRENGDPLKYDLEERSARFGEAVIRFAKKIPRGPDNDRLIGQLVGAATSIGANYCEADDAVSKKDFRCKIGTCKKEARETKFFLRMVAAAEESPEARRPRSVAGSQRTASDLLRHLEEVNMRALISTLGIRHSFVISHSTFVIFTRL
jgi:four helix bundle protein